MSAFEPAVETERIIDFLKSKVAEKDVIIGISGGIDSSVVLKIASLAIPHSRIHPFFLPERETYESDHKDVEDLMSQDDIQYNTTFIDPIVDIYRRSLNLESRVALANLKSRIRMTILYYYSNAYDGIVLGTTNRTEYFTGYYTKFGDGACDLEPIMHLYKMQVKEIATFLDVPEHIISKPPTAGLWAGQTDESELGITYRDLDEVLKAMDSGNAEEGSENYRKVAELIRRSEHKRRPPYSMELSLE